MKVILKENVYNHGVAGDVVDVSSGFARNYLIPRGMAVKASAGALRENEQLMAMAVARREELNERLNEVAGQIDGVELVFGVKAGKNGKLYGSVTTMDIARALEEKTGVDINRRRISDRALRELGIFNVPVRMSQSHSPELKVVVVREEEVDDYLAGKPVESLAQTTQARPEAEAVEEETVEAEEMVEAEAEASDTEAPAEASDVDDTPEEPAEEPAES